MKVLLLNQFFHPDLSATAQIATDLAEDLARAGVEVTALASRGSYLGGGTLPARERHSGVDIVRVTATSFGKRTLLHRAIDYASFYLSASVALARLPRQDVVVALTTPPLIAATGLVAKALKGARLVYWVQDLYPEVAVAFGALTPRSPVTSVMRALSRAVMRGADRVVTLGAEMRERCIVGGAKPERTVVIPNWADGEAVRPVPHESNVLRGELAGEARTLVMYSGNMGRAHDMETILGAARLLHANRRIRFVFIGDGVKRADVEGATRELPNVRLAPYQPREKLAESLSAADLHLIALSPEIEGLIEPSKLYGVMAAGRPALFVGPARSEVALTIERSGCGHVVLNGDAERLAATIAELDENPTKREQMGARARQVFMHCYTRQISTARFRELLVGVVEASSSVSAVEQ